MKRSGIAVRVQLFVPPEWLFVIGYLILSRLLVLPLRGFARLLPSEIRPPASPEPARHSPEAKPMANGRERWRAGFALPVDNFTEQAGFQVYLG